ncbi:hypothetical protein [Oligoflexus tunisiensis]|uniref:hypothetical protein n=1 Tax=Oligoflexus tunisiensis TaxID=708132 RepID=UPI00114CAAE8|nr:hypothetical protein [Oligoflexus tunisiensis]
MLCRKTAVLLVCASGLLSCSGKKELSRGEGFAFFKNPESNEACLNTNLSQWELSGEFLHRMLTCASNRSSDGGETLPATRKLLAELSPDKIQKLVDFALMPDESATTHEERYPYLLALSSVLDRGLTEGQKQGLNLATERLEHLQPFLLSLDPSRLQRQLTLWSQSGRLDELLAELGLLIQSLEKDSLSALTHEVLQGAHFGPRFVRVSTAVLGQDPLMESLDAALSAQTLRAPDAESQARILHDWRQPQSPDAPDRPLPSHATASAPTSFAQHLDQFTQTLSDDEIQKLSNFLISFWNSYRSLDPEERDFISRRLADGFEQGLDQQKNIARWLLALAQDLSTMPAADLNSISETLGRLLEPSNDPSLDTLRAKLWSSRIMEQLLELLTQGGAVPGCSALTIPGLKDAAPTDFAPTYEILRTLNTPQAACDGQIPITAALESWSNVAVGHACTQQNCLELTAKANDPDLTASYWSEPYTEPDPKLLQELLRQALQESRLNLERDRYHWKNIGVANRAVDPATVDQLLEQLQKAAPQSLRDLALWEKALMQDSRFQTLLAADPIEKLLSLKIERLGSLSQQFHELVPEGTRDVDKTTNQRAARVFAGVYNQGPLEQALRYKLPATLEGPEDILQDASFNWPQDVRETFADDRALFSHFLHRFKNADSIFRNPELGSLVDGADVVMASLGSPGRYVGFEQLGQVSIQPGMDTRMIQPLQSVRPASEDPAGWGLWYQQLMSSGLVSKDLPPEQMGGFHDFSAQFIQNISADARWADLVTADEPTWSQRAPGLGSEFFDVEPYTPADARMLALYYLRHYHKIPLAFPAEAQLGIVPTGGLRGFFSAAAMVRNMDADYALFVKLFPEQLGAAVPSLEALGAQAFSTALFTPTKVNPVTRVGLLENRYAELLANPNFQLLSTFNLLGLTKSGSSWYIQPLIGLDNTSCATADGTPAGCALELRGADTGVRQSQYQDFIASLIAHNFCPLLTTDQFGSRDVWVQRLQLKPADAKTCQDLKLLEAKVGDEVRFPAWLTRRILNDVFSMGRKARLKKGLAQIPAALRFHKLAQEELSANERAGLWLRQARGHWSALNAATQSRRQSYAVQFWAAQPNLLNAALGQWEQDIETISWTDFLARLAQRDGNGTAQDVVHEVLSLVISTQQDSARAGESLLEMAFTLMERISARPDLLDAAGHMLGNFASAENYDFVGRDLPYAMRLFTVFNWNEPGLRLSKFLAQKESIRLWALLCEYFSPDEMGRFLNQLQKSSVELGEKSERAGLLQRFLKEQVALGTLLENESQRTLSDRWNTILLTWRAADFGSGFLKDWESLLASLDQPLQTLDGRATHSTARILELWLPQFLRQGIGLLQLHQEAGASPETSFWSKMTLDLLQSIQAEPLGSRALARFLADPRLGFVQTDLWVRALTDARYRQPMAEGLISLSSVSEHLWREALVESSDLLARLGKALGYMKQRMVWKEDPEHNAYRIVIDQLHALSHDAVLRDSQIEILKLWFRDEEGEPRMAESPARPDRDN